MTPAHPLAFQVRFNLQFTVPPQRRTSAPSVVRLWSLVD